MTFTTSVTEIMRSSIRYVLRHSVKNGLEARLYDSVSTDEGSYGDQSPIISSDHSTDVQEEVGDESSQLLSGFRDMPDPLLAHSGRRHASNASSTYSSI